METNMFSDPLDPASQESALLPLQRKTLSEANFLMENGKPGQAAPLFAKLAEILTSAGQPRRAANLHAQAALAFAKSHNESPALMQARTALTLFLQFKIVDRASIFYANISRELSKRGMKTAVETLAREFDFRIGPQKTAEESPGRQAALLPTNCPQCGAPVHVSEVHWVNDNAAECAFCGTPLHPQK
jgi:hypothetical protein